MFHISTNRTEESWSRNDIKKVKPSEDSSEILERINQHSTEGMSFEAAVDFLKMQLGTWRRFYKESDKIDVDEAYTADNHRVMQIESLNIVYYVRDIDGTKIKITSGFYDTIKDPCKKLFEDLENPPEGKDPLEMLESAK